jgi:hypothetical protein
MTKQKFIQAMASGAAQFAAIHSICCGSQIVFAGMQVGISAASSHAIQGASYIIAPVVAAGIAWGLPLLKAQKQKVPCNDHGDCNTHSHSTKNKKLKSFLANTALGYGVSFMMMAGVTPSYEHKPQGMATGLSSTDGHTLVVKVTDDTKIWPYSQRYFMNEEPVTETGKATLVETSMARAQYQKLKMQLTTEHTEVQGETYMHMARKDFALAARMDKQDAAAFMKRKQRHMFHQNIN